MKEEEKNAIEILNKWLCKIHSEFCKAGAVGIPNEEFFATEIVLKLVYKQNNKIQKALDFINDENNFFEDGENWQNVLKIKEILEEEN